VNNLLLFLLCFKALDRHISKPTIIIRNSKEIITSSSLSYPYPFRFSITSMLEPKALALLEQNHNMNTKFDRIVIMMIYGDGNIRLG
jgi:hypothetical protein